MVQRFGYRRLYRAKTAVSGTSWPHNHECSSWFQETLTHIRTSCLLADGSKAIPSQYPFCIMKSSRVLCPYPFRQTHYKLRFKLQAYREFVIKNKRNTQLCQIKQGFYQIAVKVCSCHPELVSPPRRTRWGEGISNLLILWDAETILKQVQHKVQHDKVFLQGLFQQSATGWALVNFFLQVLFFLCLETIFSR